MSAGPTGAIRNVLFIMCDQLRSDHVSCFGGKLHTPNIDRLAARGVRFENAYVSSGVCGPSRTSYYTGRYPISHRVTWNRVPLPIDELTLGHYLGQSGRTLDLLGKTHFVPDRAGLAAGGLQVAERQQQMFDEGGFHPIERYDGHVEPAAGTGYHRYLIERGYASERPWTDFVIGSSLPDGQIASGWLLRNAPLAARVEARDSETAYLTQRAIDYIAARGDTPWVLHLSYIKPHWPFKAPAPYHAMFGADDCPAPVRSEAERRNPHPVHGAYQRHEESQAFSRDEVRRAVRPVYMGLVKQIDDELGRLLDSMEHSGRMDDTLIVFTSDHGDLAGDHWLGEKEYFFEPVMRVPFIVADPRAPALARHGMACSDFVECIDVVPTVLDALGLSPASHRIEGRSLLPLLNGAAPADWRDCVFGHLDYAYREARLVLGRAPQECTGLMVRDARHKYIHWEGFAPQLFDLRDDPQELHDLGLDPARAAIRQELQQRLFEWLASAKRRATESALQVEARTDAHERLMGIQIGRW
jgi:arylsulfatase A-like enzyme